MVIPASEGYGERDDGKLQRVPKDKLPDGVEVGAKLQAGQQAVTVVALEGEEAVVDFNHPLAGEELTFEITLDSVKAPGAPPEADAAAESNYR
eukprot:SAG31_NODE_2784_length_5092_cov_10.113158_3_plen_93_part_00